MSIFEAIMLICFGFAWPVSIVKSIRSRSTQGKSVLFLIIVLLGYVSGITHKVLNNLDWVIALYILNGLMVSVDIALYWRNARIEKKSRGDV